MFLFKNFVNHLLVTFLLAVSLIQAQQLKKLNVLVLYESLCPDSVRFMRNQLGPNFESLKDYINITLVPFGKSYSENNGANFYCQHGPAECKGNRMQSCVLHQTDDQSAQVKFAVCQMTTQDKSGVAYCAEKVGLSSDITECMKSELGTALQLQAERITATYAPSFVPTIVYEGVFQQRSQDHSLRDFLGTVCGMLIQQGIVRENQAPCNRA